MQVEVIKKDIDKYNKHVFNPNSILKVAAYCRVSTGSQEQKDSYESQVRHYRDTIKSRENWVYVDIYADEAMTGTLDYKRTDFLRMINDALNGKIDLILTKSIARFARNTVDTLKYVRLLKEKNVAIYFEEEHINTLEMAGELLLTILSSVAQQEVQNTSENVKLGLKMKMQRGEMVGANNCYGYKIDKTNKTLVIIKEEARVVREIYELYIDGYGTKGIANYLEERHIKTRKGNCEWSTATIGRILTNEKYMGDLLMGKSIIVDPIAKKRIRNDGQEDKYYVKDHHPAIISTETFEKAQQIRKSRSKDFMKRNFVANKPRNYSFTGKIFCGFCGSVYTRVLWKRKEYPDYSKETWKCRRADKRGRKDCPDSIILYNEVVENIFIDLYNSICVNHAETLDKALKIIERAIKLANTNVNAHNIDKEIKEVMNKMDELLELKLNNRIDNLIYNSKYNELSDKLNKLRRKKVECSNIQTDEKQCENKIKNIKKMFSKEKKMKKFNKEIFDTLIDKIIVGITDENGNKFPNILVVIMNTGKVRAYDYNDTNSGETRKYVDITKDFFSQNFHPSKIDNTIR